MKRRDYIAKLNPDLKLSKEQADFVRRRAEPFADRWGVQTRPLIHLLQEAYLQGMADAAEAMKAERDQLKTENEWLHRQVGKFTNAA